MRTVFLSIIFGAGVGQLGKYGVFAQTPIASPNPGLPQLSPTIAVPLTESTLPPTFTRCVVPGVSSTSPIPATVTTNYPPGAECFRIITSSGLVIEEPLFTIPSSPSPNKHASNAPVIAGAVVGSVLAITAFILGMIYFRRSKIVARRARMRGLWINRPGGWADSTKRNAEDGVGQKQATDIAL